MQGRGVTNFSADKPSHGFTTSTTEFDDALIRRGIVTTEQAMMAKGASAEDAVRLAEEKKRRGTDGIVDFATRRETDNDNDNGNDNKDGSDDDSFEDDDFDDDDVFLQRYRRQRLEELKLEQESPRSRQQQRQQQQPSSILHIRRDDWREEVNEASMSRWVIVTMTEPSGERRDRVVQELHRFAREFLPSDEGRRRRLLDPGTSSSPPTPRLLTIDAHDAIPDWPAERVPAMFVYRHGVKQHEWIAGRRGEFPSRDILEQLFRKWDAI